MITAATQNIARLIESNPDDLRLYQLLADELERAGDPRGRLIALQIAGKGDSLVGSTLAEALGPLHRYQESMTVRWRWGCVEGVRLDHEVDKSALFFEAWRPVRHSSDGSSRRQCGSDRCVGVGRKIDESPALRSSNGFVVGALALDGCPLAPHGQPRPSPTAAARRPCRAATLRREANGARRGCCLAIIGRPRSSHFQLSSRSSKPHREWRVASARRLAHQCPGRARPSARSCRPSITRWPLRRAGAGAGRAISALV